MERLALLPSLSGAANPKSSTGRLDIFTRLIVDGSEAFDDVPLGYRRAALCRNFAAQLQRARARRLAAQPDPVPQPQSPSTRTLADFALETPTSRDRHAAERARRRRPRFARRAHRARRASAGRRGRSSAIARSRTATSSTSTGPATIPPRNFWEPIRARPDGRLILDPDEFYILASREKMQIPADLAAEMAPIDPAIGEFRVHYAGFFDPGFGQGADGTPERPRRARSAQPRRAVPARRRPAGRPPRL